VDDQISHTNEHGIEVRTERRFYESINTLEEDYFENGNLIHRTHFENGEFKARLYFAFSIEQVNQLIDDSPTIKIIYRTWKNGYQIDEYIDCIDKILTAKRISVTNKSGDNICFRLLQFENGAVKLSTTEKSYFEHGELKYLFDYNPDGTCFMVNNFQSYQEDVFASDIGTDKTDFTWKGFEYYQFADPLVPETSNN
jgi:hypothetical protein